MVNPALLGAAARMDEAAAVLRARTVLIGLRAATTQWESPSARLYYAQLDEVTAGLTRCAGRLSELADLTRRLAAR